jgi:hypothetical protein
MEMPNGKRYRRLGRKMLGNGKMSKLRKKLKKRGESQPSGARCVGWLFCCSTSLCPTVVVPL